MDSPGQTAWQMVLRGSNVALRPVRLVLFQSFSHEPFLVESSSVMYAMQAASKIASAKCRMD